MAMNYVAVVKYVTGVNILAFILMSNHVHFVLECDEKEAVDYINRFKGLYGKHFQRKYGVKEYLRRNDIDIRPLKMEDESLHRAIAYVLMNSVSARLCVYSNEYRWGSGRVYYSTLAEDGIPLASMSGRAKERALHSCVSLNPDWIFLKDGYISPSSYVSVSFVEALYRTSKRMKYFLDSSSKARPKQELWETVPSFSDQVLYAAASEIRRSLFQKGENEALTEEQNAELMRQLRRRFSSDINQLCRITGMTNEEALKVFDSF